MSRRWRFLVFSISALCLSCEDVIDINLNDAAPKLMIAGTISNRMEPQQVIISRTVAFSAVDPFDPVVGAEVVVVDGRGGELWFTEDTPGIYQRTFKGETGQRYNLRVRVDGQEFTAVSTMPEPVMADSVGTAIRNIFDEEQKFIGLKYLDPAGTANYYRYLWSVNGSTPKMVRVSNDKFNDGKYVSEDVGDFDTELVTGDSVVVWMQCIDRATFDFWNAVQSNNPGSAAPANPPSVFGDGALGYFSAQTVAEYAVTVQ